MPTVAIRRVLERKLSSEGATSAESNSMSVLDVASEGRCGQLRSTPSGLQNVDDDRGRTAVGGGDGSKDECEQ